MPAVALLRPPRPCAVLSGRKAHRDADQRRARAAGAYRHGAPRRPPIALWARRPRRTRPGSSAVLMPCGPSRSPLGIGSGRRCPVSAALQRAADRPACRLLCNAYDLNVSVSWQEGHVGLALPDDAVHGATNVLRIAERRRGAPAPSVRKQAAGQGLEPGRGHLECFFLTPSFAMPPLTGEFKTTRPASAAQRTCSFALPGRCHSSTAALQCGADLVASGADFGDMLPGMADDWRS